MACASPLPEGGIHGPIVRADQLGPLVTMYVNAVVDGFEPPISNAHNEPKHREAYTMILDVYSFENIGKNTQLLLSILTKFRKSICEKFLCIK